MRRVNGLLAGVLILACLLALPSARQPVPGAGVPAELVTPAPAGVTSTLRDLARPGDRIFNPQSWGSWFEYALPDQLVAVDSRIELFTPEVWQRYEQVAAGVGDWDDQLEAWDVAFVVTLARDTAFAERLVAAGWRELHRDAEGAVYTNG